MGSDALSYDVDDDIDAKNVCLQLKVENIDGGAWERQELQSKP